MHHTCPASLLLVLIIALTARTMSSLIVWTAYMCSHAPCCVAAYPHRYNQQVQTCTMFRPVTDTASCISAMPTWSRLQAKTSRQWPEPAMRRPRVSYHWHAFLNSFTPALFSKSCKPCMPVSWGVLHGHSSVTLMCVCWIKHNVPESWKYSL